MIFDNILLLNKFGNVSISVEPYKLESYETTALNKYLLRWFSSDLIDELQSFSSEAETTTEFKGYQLFMQSLASFLLFEYSEKGEVIVSELGLVRHENEETKSAYAGQVKKFAQASLEDGFLFSGLLQDLMDENPTIFTQWEDSPAFVQRQGLVVKSAKIFNEIKPLSRPNHTFNHLIPTMKTIQIMELENFIPEALISEFIAYDSITDPNKKKAADLVRSAIVYRTVSTAIISGMVEVRSGTISVSEDDKDTNSELKKAPQAYQASAQFNQENKLATAMLEKARKILIDNGFIILPTRTSSGRFIA